MNESKIFFHFFFHLILLIHLLILFILKINFESLLDINFQIKAININMNLFLMNIINIFCKFEI
jgi:hypothetical protein